MKLFFKHKHRKTKISQDVINHDFYIKITGIKSSLEFFWHKITALEDRMDCLEDQLNRPDCEVNQNEVQKR